MSELRFRQGAGRLCLDYIRTLRYRGAELVTEELPDAESLAAWWEQCGPSIPLGVVSAAEVRDARRLRESVYELVTAALGPGVAACRASARERVNRAALASVPTPRLSAGGQMRWYAEDPLSALQSLLARDAVELVSSPAVARVHRCANPLCAALFLDTSRPGARRWCSMSGCGNLEKKRTQRSKVSLSG